MLANTKQSIESFIWLGKIFSCFLEKEKNQLTLSAPLTDDIYTKINTGINYAYQKNGWFTRNNILKMLSEIAAQLTEEKLTSWLNNYIIPAKSVTKQVAIIMAGNIPLVGFNDMLCVLITGNKAIIKLSSDDDVLPKLIIDLLKEHNSYFINYIQISEAKLPMVDAVIATGSNNSARYFTHYFGKYPHIIRKNRHSVALLNREESTEELQMLGDDIFTYFGLGCRNISKLYVPENYSFNLFFEAIFPYNNVINNKKYGNNYDYNRAIYLLNKEPFLDNNFLILKQDSQLSGGVAVLFYELYQNEADLALKLNLQKEHLQCVLSSGWYPGSLNFGQSQCPTLLDYADGVDTFHFLLTLQG